MIRYLPEGAASFVPADYLRRAGVGHYLNAIDSLGQDLTWDRAILLGELIVREVMAGRWEEHRALALRTFDEDEFDVIALAAVSYLRDPATTPPEPFASWINLARDATALGLTPEDVVERIGPYLVPVAPAEGEDA